MKKNLLLLIIFSGILMMIVFASCATAPREARKPPEVKPEVVPQVEKAGIMGRIMPVDSSGVEIAQEVREKAVINCIPLKEGSQLKERSVTENPEPDGSFSMDLKKGEYLVEIFLEGFYVRSFKITVEENRRVNLGDIRIQRIESGSGIPLKGDEIEEIFMNEGDVSIQPPSH
jgi:hypothetical protein